MEKPSPLSAEAQGQIQALARQISVANHLDVEIQAELETHMEDQASAYVSGARRLTEADAMLLTRAHFGKTEVIKSLLQRVHVREYHFTLARRLAVVFCASVAAPVFIHLVSYLYFWPTLNMDPSFRYFVKNIFTTVGSLLLLCGLLVYLRRRLRHKRPIWILTLSGRSLALLLIVTLVAFLASPNLIAIADYYFYRSIGLLHWYDAPWVEPTLLVVRLIYSVLTCLLWLWWTDTRPRSRNSLLYTALAWLAFKLSVSLIAFVVISYLQIFRHTQIGWGQGNYVACTVAIATVAVLVYAFFTRRGPASSPVAS
jgi:hypothetical protein